MLKKLFILVVIAVLAVGCTTANKAYVYAMNDSLEVIIPNYHKYLDNDKTLKDIEREVMKKASQDTLELSRKYRRKVDGS